MARILIFGQKDGFSSEVCIISKESHKILHFVDTLYNFSDEKDALDSSVQRLSKFLNPKH